MIEELTQKRIDNRIRHSWHLVEREQLSEVSYNKPSGPTEGDCDVVDAPVGRRE